MPKVSRVGKFRQTAAAAVANSSPANASIPAAAASDDPLSRGQRKRQAKKDQYLKRQKLVLSTLRLQHDEDQKKRIDGLDALKEALVATLEESTVHDDSDNNNNNNNKKNTCLLGTNKNKKELTAREVSHLGLVLEHPAFQSNPFEAIQQHLKNTLAGQAKELQQEATIRAKKDEKLAAKTKKAKKAKLQDRGGKQRKKFKAGRTRK